tara:strand:+ start:17294 stop:17488 length:195 start_codon:yes stop_codon:yes gene_type:complete
MSTRTEVTGLIYIALSDRGLVMAHFMLPEDSSAFCTAHGYCHMPFNLNNRDGAPAPLVGTVYQA